MELHTTEWRPFVIDNGACWSSHFGIDWDKDPWEDSRKARTELADLLMKIYRNAEVRKLVMPFWKTVLSEKVWSVLKDARFEAKVDVYAPRRATVCSSTAILSFEFLTITVFKMCEKLTHNCDVLF